MIAYSPAFGSSVDDPRTSDIPTTEDVGMVTLDRPPAQLDSTLEQEIFQGPAIDPISGDYIGPPLPKPKAPSSLPTWALGLGFAAVGLGIAAAYAGGRS